MGNDWDARETLLRVWPGYRRGSSRAGPRNDLTWGELRCMRASVAFVLSAVIDAEHVIGRTSELVYGSAFVLSAPVCSIGQIWMSSNSLALLLDTSVERLARRWEQVPEF